MRSWRRELVDSGAQEDLMADMCERALGEAGPTVKARLEKQQGTNAGAGCEVRG